MADPTSSDDAPADERSDSFIRGVVVNVVGAAVILLVAVLLVGVSVFIAWSQWQRANDLEDGDKRRAAAAVAASDFVTELLGYDHRDLDSHEQRIGQSATDRFLAEYQRALDGGLRDNIVALEAVATVTVRDVFVGDVSSDRVEVVIVADTEAVSRTGTRRLVGAYLQVALQWDQDSGSWLVDEVTTVATLDEVLEPPAGEAPVDPTSPPSPTSTPSPSPATSPTSSS